MAGSAPVKTAKKPAVKPRKTQRKTTEAPAAVYVLLDEKLKHAGTYDSVRDAQEDAVGPRFRSFSIVEYVKSKTVYRYKEKR